MKKANEIIYKEANEIKTLMLKWQLNSEKLNQYNKETIRKLYDMVKNWKL
jgi:uncharacterized protein YfkK (UPF0435 family)